MGICAYVLTFGADIRVTEGGLCGNIAHLCDLFSFTPIPRCHMATLTLPQLQQALGLQELNYAISTGLVTGSVANRETKKIFSPADGTFLGEVAMATEADYEAVITKAQEAFVLWRSVPAPKRGDIIRQYGEVLRQNKEALGQLVSLEMGKIYQEGLGEVQEMIDICEFAVGLSRQLYGYTMHSERPSHRMYDQYHPLGIIGVISAFNFPVAVWAWNAALAAVCGDVTVWKPSEKTPLTAIACQNLLQSVLRDNNLPEGIFSLIVGQANIGKLMAADKRVPLVSATGSTPMGKDVGATVAARLGRSLLELGGNNAVIITPNANIEMAIRSTAFGALGTAGQRCTTTRRLIVHADVYDMVRERLLKIYSNIPVGHPTSASTLVGPLIDQLAVNTFRTALDNVVAEGGKILAGGQILTEGDYAKGNYVYPALVEADNSYATVQHETFAPILYLLKYSGPVENAIAIQNDVKQGLSSSIFTLNMQEAEAFLAHWGSDCGIANVNIGTSGAEIGGAFGGEKETGGGRESGSDAWKVYMRRQTNTINYSNNLPLAQGIKFDL